VWVDGRCTQEERELGSQKKRKREKIDMILVSSSLAANFRNADSWQLLGDFGRPNILSSSAAYVFFIVECTKTTLSYSFPFVAKWINPCQRRWEINYSSLRSLALRSYCKVIFLAPSRRRLSAPKIAATVEYTRKSYSGANIHSKGLFVCTEIAERDKKGQPAVRRREIASRI
jgi:hypothetical protein